MGPISACVMVQGGRSRRASEGKCAAETSIIVLATNICPSALASEPPPRAFLVEESSDVDMLYLMRSSGRI